MPLLRLRTDKENSSVNRTFEIKDNNAKAIFYEIPNTPVVSKRKSRANNKIKDEIRKSLNSTVTLRRTFERQQLERRQQVEKRLTEKKPKRPTTNDQLNQITTVQANSNGTFVKNEKKSKSKEKICDVVYLKTINNLLNAINGHLDFGRINSNFRDDVNYIDIFQENISKLSSHLHAKLKFNAGLKLLRWYRGRLEIRKAREQLNELRTRRNAAIVIQSAWRKHQAKKAVRSLVAQRLKERRDAAVLTIQKNYRLHSARKQSNKLREEERKRNASAKVIQRSWKVYLFRSRLNRSIEWRRVERTRQRAAQLIQKNWKNRVFKTRLANLIEKRRVDRLRDQSVGLIQKNWRAYLFRKRFSQMVEHKQQVKQRSAVLLQKNWRVYAFRKSLNCRIEQRKIRVLNECASLIQRNWRIYRFRKHLDELIKQRQNDELVRNYSATLIQACWRGYRSRKHQAALVEQQRAKEAACVKLQRAWRRYQFVKRLDNQIKIRRLQSASALLIQTNWRVYRAKKQLNQLKRAKHQQAALLIQRNWHSYVFRTRFASQMQANQEARRARRDKAARVVQRAWRNHLNAGRQSDVQRRISAAIRIQATWRGYLARQNCIRDHKNASIILGRLSEVNKAAITQTTVGQKTKNAISKLLNYKYHGTALQLLQELEKTTNLSNESCIQMAELPIIEVLLKVVGECNRSEPCLQIIKLAFSVILNIAKNDKALPLLCSIPSLKESIIETLNKHLKKTGIFLKAMTLLYILLKYDDVSVLIGSLTLSVLFTFISSKIVKL